MVPLPEVSISNLNFRLKMIAADWGVRLANVVGIICERSGNWVYLEGGKNLVGRCTPMSAGFAGGGASCCSR